MVFSSSSIAFSSCLFGAGISTTQSSSSLFLHYYYQRPFCTTTTHAATTTTTTMVEASSSSSQLREKQLNSKKNKKPQLISLNKRKFCGFTISLLLLSPPPPFSVAIAAAEDDHHPQLSFELERYTDTEKGFTLLKPSSWIKVDKAGATVLFEDPNKGANNNLGIVVSPVRLSSLGEFGTPQFVADKLIQAEKRKESTKDAEVVEVAERLGHAGLQVYEFEYKLDSTRGGLKRIFSAAFVASKKLYLLNLAYSDRAENPLDTSNRVVLEQILHSFETTSK